MTAIYKRELKSYLTSMVGYLFIFFILVLTGIYFSAYQLSAAYPKFEYTLSAITFAFLIGVPILTMRVLAEERKQKTDQLLLTAPVSVSGIVIGKYLALVTVFAVPMAVMCTYPLIMSRFGTVEFASAYTAVLGFFLLGCANIAIGVFMSALTESQVIAAVLTFVFLFAFYMMNGISSFFSQTSMSTCVTFGLLILAAAITVGVLFSLIIYILVNGVVHLKPELFAWEYNTSNMSMMPAIINTVLMVLLVLLFAVPVGIGAAIYLVEYAKRGSKLVKLVRITAETLSGIPSIVYGLFGYLLFATTFKWGYTFLGGALTLAIMILPLILRTTEEALKAVPDSFREGSFGLGAGRLRTIFRIILPSAVPGIVSGVILGIGRVVGETAALMYTAGTIAKVPGLMSSGRTLAVHMYALLSEGLYMKQAYATAVVLLIVVLLINAGSGWIAKKLTKR